MSQETLNLPNLQVVNALRIVWLQILGKDDIAHVLFLDLVGFTTLKAAKQRLFLGKFAGDRSCNRGLCASRIDNHLMALPSSSVL